MKIGSRVRCIRSDSESLYSVGTLYEVEGLAGVNGMLLRDNQGDLDPIPIPMDGAIWGFEPVDEDEQTEALIKLLEISQADVAAGRVMTREEALEGLAQGRTKKD